MRRSIRLAVAGCAALATLAFAGSAWAAYTPRLIATSLSNAPGKPTTMLLGHVQEPGDDPTAKDTIYAPLGYRVNLSQAVGAKIGDVDATLILRGAGNAQVDVKGEVVVDNAAAHPADPCAPGLHTAVWKLNITVAGTPLTVFVYVDAITAGPEATFASAKIQLCLAGPIGTPAGAQLLFAIFDVNRVFTNPSASTDRVWRGIFTPYVPGSATPNPGGTVEGQALVPGRFSLKLTVKRLKRGVVLIQGRLLVDGRAFQGADIDLFVGVRKIASAKTNRTGRFTFRRRIKRKTQYRALAAFLGDLTSCPVAALPTVPQGCKTATLSFVGPSNAVTARPKR